MLRNNKAKIRIHIVGCGPRTGTTLMAEMAIACFDIDAYTEHEDPIYTRPNQPANIFLTKRPRDILVAGPMLRLLSNLYVIYLSSRRRPTAMPMGRGV